MVSGDGACNAQGDAFFSKQCVSTISAAVGPDLAGLGEMDDVFFVVAGPGHIVLAGFQGSTDTVEAWDKRAVGTEFAEDLLAHVAHDPHADDDVGRVGQFDSYEGQGAIDWPHAKRDHIHRPPAHAGREFFLEQPSHFVGVLPVVGRTGIGFPQRADKGPVLDACCVRGMAAGQERVRVEFLVESNERIGLDELVGQGVPFLVATVAQHDAIGLAHPSHFANPLFQCRIGAIEWEFF